MKRQFLAALGAVLVLGFLVPAQSALAAAPTGSLVNPSAGGPGTLLGDKDDGTDTDYHFVVRAAASGGATLTQVAIQAKLPGSIGFVTLGFATPVANTDAWELKWPQSAVLTPDQNDKDGRVRAVATDSNGDVTNIPDVNGLLVHFNNAEATAEITDPTDGGQLGFTGGSTTLRGTASSDVTRVNVYYTKTGLGTAPTWTMCGTTPVVPMSGTWSLSCGLVGNDTPTSVTAVAVSPVSDVPVPDTPGIGDAHAVIPFVSEPNSIQLSPVNVRQSVDHCQLITVKVLDNNNVSLPSRNVDVHIIGPDAKTYFAVDHDRTSAFTSPEFPTAGHGYETADTCNDNNVGSGGGNPGTPATSGDEGTHPASGSTPARKHIEGSTGTTGVFTFAISSDSVGTVTVEAWYDVTDNDANDNPDPGCPASGATAAEPCAKTTVVFEIADPASVSLQAATEQADLGKSRKVTAKVIDQHNNPLAGAPVSYEVTSGANAGQDLDGSASTPNGYFGFCLTAGNGTCFRSYTDKAKVNGNETITGWIDGNGNLAPDGGEVQGTAQQVWGSGTPPPPQCSDGTDNDNDGLTDFPADPGCTSAEDNDETDPPPPPCNGQPCSTSLTIHPRGDKSIHKGDRVHFHGLLISSEESCVAGQTVTLFNGHGKAGRFTVDPSTVVTRDDGTFAARYDFLKQPRTTQYYHVGYTGNQTCAPSRAPKQSAVRVRVRPR